MHMSHVFPGTAVINFVFSVVESSELCLPIKSGSAAAWCGECTLCILQIVRFIWAKDVPSKDSIFTKEMTKRVIQLMEFGSYLKNENRIKLISNQ